MRRFDVSAKEAMHSGLDLAITELIRNIVDRQHIFDADMRYHELHANEGGL